MGNFFEDLFGSKKTETKPLMRLPGQMDAYANLLDYSKGGAYERLDRAGEPYSGKLTAGLSGPEQTGLDSLEGWLGSASPADDELFGLSRQEYERTLGGDYYDPAEGQYYQAYRSAMQRELEEAKDRLAATTSARDMYYGGGRIATEGEMEEDYLGNLGVFLGNLTERERQRRLGSVPGAMGLLGMDEAMTENRIAASQRYGALPREIEQMGLDREYGEYIRQLQDLGIPLEVAMNLALYKADYTTQSKGGQFWDLLQPLSQLGGGGGGITSGGGGGFQGLASLGQGAGQFMGGAFGPTASQYGVTGGLIGPPTQAAAAGQGFGGALSGIGGLFGSAASGIGGAAAGAASGVGSGIASLFGLLSDIRFKENVIPIEGSLEKVKQLDGKTYNYTEAPEISRGGIIAQDLEKVLPEAVKTIEGIKFIMLDAVMGLLVNAVKELDEKIERISV